MQICNSFIILHIILYILYYTIYIHLTLLFTQSLVILYVYSVTDVIVQVLSIR